jgi:hypothetical protein
MPTELARFRGSAWDTPSVPGSMAALATNKEGMKEEGKERKPHEEV